ncbi:MAG: nucleoside phosphorylase [Crocinitomicaceae bacterium]|nr:nucleoside phosphorylase [Crocinitomicaceae bacterium]
MFYPASELVLNANNQVYHLGISPEDIAEKIILVGDQDRVQLVSNFFDTIRHTSQHREFVVHTGSYKGKELSVISTGIGTDNIDIVINEIDALFNIDLHTRREKTAKKALEFVRIGTCGILQSNIPLHSYILSEHAIGLDNIAHFYQIPYSEIELKKGTNLNQQLGLPSSVIPYFVDASPELVHRFSSEQTYQGITITSSGFYAPQGRELRAKRRVQHMNEHIEKTEIEGEKIVNFEMESSAIFALSKALNHQATTICLGVANRPNFEFSQGFEEEMNQLIVYVLERF